MNDPRSLAELPPGILVCVLEDTEFYITIGEGPDFERWLKFQTAGLKKVKGIPHTVQMVDSSLDNPVKTSRHYLITIAVPGETFCPLWEPEKMKRHPSSPALARFHQSISANLPPAFWDYWRRV